MIFQKINYEIYFYIVLINILLIMPRTLFSTRNRGMPKLMKPDPQKINAFLPMIEAFNYLVPEKGQAQIFFAELDWARFT